jgi:hypothetical protein
MNISRAERESEEGQLPNQREATLDAAALSRCACFFGWRRGAGGADEAQKVHESSGALASMRA